MSDRSRTISAVCAAAVLAASAAGAGTVTAERVIADLILTDEIGPRPPREGMLFYPFDEDGGGTVMDASGNGNHGVVSGCAWTAAGHRSAGAMSFDGWGDSINAGPVSDFPALERYSVSLWFLHDGGGDSGPGYGHKLLDKTSWYHDWTLALSPNTGHVGLSLYENGVSTGLGDTSANYMDGAWHHIAVARDGQAGRLWVDGVLKVTVNDMFSVYSTSDVCVGNSFSGDYYQRKGWSGLLDQVRVFGRALTFDEVATLHAEGAPSAPVSVSVAANLVVRGGLSADGAVSFASGVLRARALGDLSCGIYTAP